MYSAFPQSRFLTKAYSTNIRWRVELYVRRFRTPRRGTTSYKLLVNEFGTRLSRAGKTLFLVVCFLYEFQPSHGQRKREKSPQATPRFPLVEVVVPADLAARRLEAAGFHGDDLVPPVVGDELVEGAEQARVAHDLVLPLRVLLDRVVLAVQ